VLAIQPVTKSWGPDYYQVGLGLSTDFSGATAFQLIIAQRLTWLNSRGLEWRNQLALGNVSGLSSELRQPLDAARRWFIAGHLSGDQRYTDVFFDNDAIARYREREAWGGVDLGRSFGTLGEMRFGYEYGVLRGERSVGDPVFPTVVDRVGALRAALVVDNLDDWNFPRLGHFVSADVRVARTALGSTNNSEKASIKVQQAFGDARNSVVLGARYGDSWGYPLSFMDAFELGGFQQLSGYSPRAFIAEEYVLGRVIYQRELSRAAGVVPAVYAGGSLEGANLHDVLNTSESPGFVWGSSLFIAADTSIGPLYLAVGVGQGGQRAVYLFLGRP
jgi:NTE family protein